MIPETCEYGCKESSACVVGFAGEFPSAIAVCDGCRKRIFDLVGSQPCSPVILPVGHPHAEKTYADFETARQKAMAES